jgi:hypothetical protein
MVNEPRKSLLGSKPVRAFETKVISELPPIKTEELMGRTIILLGIVGELNAGDFGPSYVVEITSPEDTTVGHSWLVNKASVLGKQLAAEVEREGRNTFPYSASLVELPSRQGRPYISFAPPVDPNADMVNELYNSKGSAQSR